MNRISTALLAALEALITVAIGIGIPLVPLTVLWATSFGMKADWFGIWRASADIWLLGHGVDLTVQLPVPLAAATGLPGAEQPFTLTIAVLGFAVLTAVLGVHAGRRSAIGGARMLGVIVAFATFTLLSAGIVLSSGAVVARPSHLQGFLLPPLIYLVAVFAGSEWAMHRLAPADRDPLARLVRLRIGEWPDVVSSGIAAAVRGATVAVTGVVAVSAVLVAIALVTHYGTIIALYETLQPGVTGGVAITLLQLALLPNAVIWASAWLIGPGFALGAGTSVAPSGTVLGAVPGLPLFGAVPEGAAAVGLLGALVPILLGFIAGWVAARRMRPGTPMPQLAAVGAGVGILAGIALGLASWWSAGSLGPGRLAVAGPEPLVVAAIVAAEVGIPAVIGILGSRFGSRDREQESSPDARADALRR